MVWDAFMDSCMLICVAIIISFILYVACSAPNYLRRRKEAKAMREKEREDDEKRQKIRVDLLEEERQCTQKLRESGYKEIVLPKIVNNGSWKPSNPAHVVRSAAEKFGGQGSVLLTLSRFYNKHEHDWYTSMTIRFVHPEQGIDQEIYEHTYYTPKWAGEQFYDTPFTYTSDPEEDGDNLFYFLPNTVEVDGLIIGARNNDYPPGIYLRAKK